MKTNKRLRVRGWYPIGGLAALVLVSLVLTSGGAFARIPGGGAERSYSAKPGAPHAAFTPGNLVIYRVGDGGTSLVNTGNPVFLDEYTTSGTLVQSIALPIVASVSDRRFIASGSATSEGLLTRSTDGLYLLLTGYDAATGGGTNLTTSSALTINRVVGRVDPNGNV